MLTFKSLYGFVIKMSTDTAKKILNELSVTDGQVSMPGLDGIQNEKIKGLNTEYARVLAFIDYIRAYGYKK